ncbi:MAG: site-2 protease family protein [Vulcanimicrobiaceae bacterium]
MRDPRLVQHPVQPAEGAATQPGAARPEPVEGKYLPPPPAAGRNWRAAGAGAVGIGLFFAKFQGLLFLLLNAKWAILGFKVLISSFSFIASVGFYALFWGWKFALGFTILILIHEFGHVLTMRFFGMPAALPYFVPGLGAFVTLPKLPASPLAEAYIALAGPMLGGLAALGCYALGQSTGSDFWYALAYTGFFLNVFNLAPIPVLDGGRVVAAISPRVWIVGLIALVAFALLRGWWNPILLLIVLVGIPQAIAAWRGQLDARYATITADQRVGVALAYFALMWFLIDWMLRSHVPTGAHFNG